MEKGKIVKIYQKPLTEKDYEGEAILIQRLHVDNVMGTEDWLVKFNNGDKVQRTIKQR